MTLVSAMHEKEVAKPSERLVRDPAPRLEGSSRPEADVAGLARRAAANRIAKVSRFAGGREPS
jgi:hypothetical protein